MQPAQPTRYVVPSQTHRRASVLLEMIVAMALFVGAASLTLSAARDVLTAMERASIEMQLIDIARSRMAELEAGIITLADLREDDGSGIGSQDDERSLDDQAAARWVVEARAERTEFTGLTLVELTVSVAPTRGADGITDDDAPSFTLRQLVAVADDDEADEAFELDDMFQGLPDPIDEVTP